MKTSNLISELVVFAHNNKYLTGEKLENLLNDLTTKGIAKIDGFIYVYDPNNLLN